MSDHARRAILFPRVGDVAWGLVTRDGLGRVLLTGYGFSLMLFTAFGIWQGGFPEFSTLGWI